MALIKYKLGDLIEQQDERNNESKYTINNVKGMSVQKVFIETKANMEGVSLNPYIIVEPDYFAYVTVTSRNSEKITLAHNTTNKTYIVSSSYVVFKVKHPELLDSDYLFMFFNRPEFDRLARFNSWGSARETFDWSDFCDIEIELPSLETQQKYVEVYNSMLSNQQSYERGLDDLKLVCDAYIEDLRRNMPCENIEPYIKEINLRNTDLSIDNVRGVDSSSRFVETRANTVGLEFNNYKIVRKGQFAYNPSRINLGSIALLREKDCVISPMYIVFEIIRSDELLSEYLMLWLNRSEFLRSTLFYAAGSVRDTFGFAPMCEVEIPIPKIEIQQDIVNIYNAYNKRKTINEKLKDQIKNICPILIKGSLEE